MTDAADLARRLERAERAASTYHAWLRVLVMDDGFDGSDVVPAGEAVTGLDRDAVRQLVDQPWREAFELRAAVFPEHGPWCSGHGTFTMPDDAPTSQPPRSLADLVTPRPDGGVDIAVDHPLGPMRWELPVLEEAVRTFGGDVAGARAKLEEWRDLAARWTSLVAALRPLVEACDRRMVAFVDGGPPTPEKDAVMRALAALRWFVGLEPEVAVEPPAPIPPEVLERLDALRATVPDPGSVFEAPIRRELDKIREEKARRMPPLPKIPPKRGGRP